MRESRLPQKVALRLELDEALNCALRTGMELGNAEIHDLVGHVLYGESRCDMSLQRHRALDRTP